jgi:ATP-dependent RNA helicase DHX29
VLEPCADCDDCGAGAEGSVEVLSTAKDNWVPQSREPEEVKVSTEQLEIRICWRRREDNVSLDDGRSSQAAWIRQYMEQEEEVLVYEHVIFSFPTKPG